MDQDLLELDRETMIAEIMRQRAGIREHRDSTEHELSWHHPKLWGLLPEKSDPVPAWPQFLRGCLHYRESLDRQLPDAPRTHAELRTSTAGNEASHLRPDDLSERHDIALHLVTACDRVAPVGSRVIKATEHDDQRSRGRLCPQDSRGRHAPQ